MSELIKAVYRIMIKFLIIASAVCLVVFCAMSALSVISKGDYSEKEMEISAKEFPLEIDLCKTAFNVGEKISFNATITNNCGKDVTVGSNGFMPCVYLHEINDTTVHGETTMLYIETLKANDKMTRVFEHELVETGIYVIYVHYTLNVDGVTIKAELDDIIIEVK